MKKLLILISFIGTTMGMGQENIYSFTFNSIDGVTHSFEEFKGRNILIVNTASECGFTPQYEELQELHDTYGSRIVIIGFPANNFGGQEPGSNDEIQEFCKVNYGVTFLMAEKVSVNGADITPLFKWLCEQPNETFGGPIQWNFEKFFINRKGKVAARYRSAVKPMDKSITSRID